MNDWRDWINNKSALLPCQSLLHPNEKLPGFNEQEFKRVAVPFGLVGRLVKEGQSVALGLDSYGPKERCHLAYFLHTLHFEACQGLITGKWVSAVRSRQTRHLMVWGPNREWDVCLADAQSQLHTLHLKKATKEILKRDPDSLRTMLISRRARNDSSMEELVSILSPFCILIDATPWGYRKDFSIDWKTLSTYFPDIPKVVIFNRGDLSTKQEISTQALHQIVWRHEDEQSSEVRPVSKPILLVSPDKVMDHYIGKSSQSLLAAIQRNRNEDSEILRLSRALLSQMTDMVSPFSVYQKALAKQTGAATYMQKTPATRLDLLENSKSEYGMGAALKSDIVSNMRDLFGRLEHGEPGKVALVRGAIEKAIRNGESILVITKTENDATTLMRHIMDSSDGIGMLTEQFQCMGVGKRWPISAWSIPFDQILVTCTLWFADLWLLDIPNAKVSWLCYPHEIPIRQAAYNALYKKALARSSPDGDKSTLICYQWRKNSYLQDWQTIFGVIPTCDSIEMSACRGIYSLERDNATLNFEWDSEAAFDRMLEYDETTQDAMSLITDKDIKELAVITWEEEDNTFIVNPKTKLKVISAQDDSLNDVYCFDLKPGDQVVLMLQDSQTVTDIFNAISDQLSSDMTLGLMLRKIDTWHQLIDILPEKYSVKEIKTGLAKSGIIISETQIRNWLHHRVHGPERAETIKSVADLCKNKSAKKNAEAIFSAMEEYRKWRRALGKFVKKALKEGYARKGLIIDGIEISSEAIEELLIVRTVREVISPPPTWSDKQGRHLQCLIPKVENELGDLIELTPRCKASMKASPFINIDVAYKLFELMHSELSKVYQKTIRLEKAVKALEAHSIFYRGDTSESTKGKFANDYFITYREKKYQAGKHLVIGNSRDPKFTLRVYFDWDESQKKIIVFHAGRHLPTRTG